MTQELRTRLLIVLAVAVLGGCGSKPTSDSSPGIDFRQAERLTTERTAQIFAAKRKSAESTPPTRSTWPYLAGLKGLTDADFEEFYKHTWPYEVGDYVELIDGTVCKITGRSIQNAAECYCVKARTTFAPQLEPIINFGECHIPLAYIRRKSP